MLNSINLKELTKIHENPVTDYKDCLKQIVRQIPNENSFLDECQQCPATLNFTQRQRYFKCAIQCMDGQVQIEESEDFVECLSEKLLVLKLHSFITKQQ